MDIDPTTEADAAQKEVAWKFVPLQLCILFMQPAQTD
jgi:hypothetical protein